MVKAPGLVQMPHSVESHTQLLSEMVNRNYTEVTNSAILHYMAEVYTNKTTENYGAHCTYRQSKHNST